MKFIWLLILTSLTISAGVQKMTPIVFVHGAHFSEKSFQLLQDTLQEHVTYSVQLFRVSEDPRSLTLTLYAKRVCEILKELESPAVLIAHSQGGAVANQAFGLCASKIKSLIYIAATVPFPNELPFGLLEQRDDEYYFAAIKESEAEGLFIINNLQSFFSGFAQDSDDYQKQAILQFVRHEPILPSKEKLSFNLEIYQQVKKIFIITTQDRILTPKTQMTYLSRLQSTKVVEIESGHLPMITKTKDLAKIIKENI